MKITIKAEHYDTMGALTIVEAEVNEYAGRKALTYTTTIGARIPEAIEAIERLIGVRK